MIRLAKGAGWEPYGAAILVHPDCGHDLICWWKPTLVNGAWTLGRCTCTHPGCRKDFPDVVLEGWAS